MLIYIILAVGVLLIATGVVLFIRKNVQGENTIKMFGFEIQSTNPSIVIIALGCAIFLTPIVNPGLITPSEIIGPEDPPLSTFIFNSEEGNFNQLIRTKLENEGYIYSLDNPYYDIKLFSDKKDPVVNPETRTVFFKEYSIKESNLYLSIDKNDKIGFSINLSVPATGWHTSRDLVDSLYEENYKETINNNIDLIYNSIKSHAPKIEDNIN